MWRAIDPSDIRSVWGCPQCGYVLYTQGTAEHDLRHEVACIRCSHKEETSEQMMDFVRVEVFDDAM